MILAAAAAVVATWVPIGVSDSRLRVFYDRASLRAAGDHRSVRIRIGAPRRIAGPIVLVYQDEELDCRARTWRLVSFDARDADDRLVRSSPIGATPGAALPAIEGTIGGEVVRAVCADQGTSAPLR